MLLIVRKTGRLGNRLRLFSHVMAWSLEHKIPIANPAFFKYAGLFEGSADADPWIRFSPSDHVKGGGTSDRASRDRHEFRSLGQAVFRQSLFPQALAYHLVNGLSRAQSFTGSSSWPFQRHSLELAERLNIDDADFIHTARKRILMIDGYRYRCPHLLLKHQDAIRTYFRLVPDLAEQVKKLVSPLNTSPRSRIVGIHIRQGDYKTYRNGLFYFPIVAYQRKMKQIERLYPRDDVKFLVCSDADLTEADFPNQEVVVSRSSPVVDMYGLARCHQIMGPPSTFTQWSSFYGGCRLFHLRSADARVTDASFEPDAHLNATNLLQAG